MKPLVTALIDTYNHENHIERALVSILEQGLSAGELEIVVVDDGSTDRTASIVEKFKSRVKLIRKPNGGQASAFNAGFAESRGDMIAMLDGDDWWATNKLQTVLKAFDENPDVAAVSHGYYEFFEGTQEVRVHRPDRETLIYLTTASTVKEAHNSWRYLLPSALTVRRKVLEWILPLPENMVFMADTPIQIAAMFMGILILEEPLFYYRQHDQNLFAIDSSDRNKLRRRSEMAKLVYRRLPEMFIRRGVHPECIWALLLPQEEHWFQFDPPSRGRFLWFLLRQNYWCRSQQTWRFTGLNYLTAFAALYFGYRHHDRMYEWRGRATEAVERWYRSASIWRAGS
jgi:glycosyltransferase involved in cell wall biosynthesis